LLEPQRTNLALQSSSFDSATWAKTRSTVTANATTSPSGIVDADKLIPSVDNNNHIITQISIPVTAQIYTASVYAKKGEYDTVRLLLSNLWASPNPNAIFNLTTKTVFSTQNATAKITELENDWFRLEITATINATAGANAHLIIYAGDNDNVTFAGDGTSGLFLWGAQLEAGAYPTSYIPTTSASVTRNQDIVNKTGISSLIGQTEGVIYWEGIATMQTDILGTNRSTVNGIYITKGSGNLFRVSIYNSSNFIALTDTIIRNSNTKIAVSYKSGNTSLFVNGVKVATSSDSLTFNASLDDIRLNDNYLIGINSFFTKSVLVYKTALTDTQLAQLTTI
jgi:hypothetical protein